MTLFFFEEEPPRFADAPRDELPFDEEPFLVEDAFFDEDPEAFFEEAAPRPAAPPRIAAAPRPEDDFLEEEPAFLEEEPPLLRDEPPFFEAWPPFLAAAFLAGEAFLPADFFDEEDFLLLEPLLELFFDDDFFDEPPDDFLLLEDFLDEDDFLLDFDEPFLEAAIRFLLIQKSFRLGSRTF